MRALLGVLCVCAAALAVPTAAVTYFHQRMAAGLGNASTGIVSERGFVAYLAGLPTGSYYDPWVGGGPFAINLMTGNRHNFLYKFDSNGVLLWGLLSDALATNRHVLYGQQDLSAQVQSTSDGTGAGFDAAGLTPGGGRSIFGGSTRRP